MFRQSVAHTETDKEIRDEAIRIAELLSESQIPAIWHDELIGYFAHRRAPFSTFLRAMLENNAALAWRLVRSHDLANGFLSVLDWLVRAKLPPNSWGSEEIVSTWLTPAHHLTEQP